MNKMKIRSGIFLGVMGLVLAGCGNNDLTSSKDATLTDVAQTSGQLASGASFVISGSSSSTAGAGGMGINMMGGAPGGMGMGRGHKGGGHGGFLDGTSLLAPTDELLAIVEAESAGDFRGMRMHAMGGATVTHFDASGNQIAMPAPAEHGGGPEGCSFSGKQFPKFDSLLAKIAKTVIDFGDGVTNQRGGVSITRSGKIVITRSGDGANHSEVVTFENFVVNGASIVGTKTRSSSFNETTGVGESSTVVAGGKITFSDGTVSEWTSTRTRTSTITLDAEGRPASGTIVIGGKTTVIAADGTVIYSHEVVKPIVENIACGHHRPPVEGTVSTVYREDKVSIDFGDGSCDSQTVTVTLNGVVSTKTFGD